MLQTGSALNRRLSPIQLPAAVGHAKVPAMTDTTPSSRLDPALEKLPLSYPGPGGAAAVLRNGEVIVRHAWGWANAERRIPFTPQSLFRMCSITKQFTCALVLDSFADPTVLDGDVQARLPRLEGPVPGAVQLCHNQSGLRDYWAVAMLQGSPAEAPFGEDEAAAVIASSRSLQFAPGARYSYCNQNFRILSDSLQKRSGRSFAELLRSRIFERVGMASAMLAADSRAMPDGTEGYEGNQATGFRAAENRIIWTGDAGLGASLDDMIAWERYIDSARDDTASLPARLSVPVTFADGNAAAYGFGLSRSTEFGRATIGHGGALRGWRAHRLYLPAERISVVTMFNHLSDARAAALDLLAAMLDEKRSKADATRSAPPWLGNYVEPETGLAVRIEGAAPGQIRLRYGHSAEDLDLQADGSARGAGGTALSFAGSAVRMDRPQENQSSTLRACPGKGRHDVSGRYRSVELGCELSVVEAGGALYGAFSGFLGQGRMELLNPVGPDLWTLPCHRALDHTPPGDWTLAFRRGSAGRSERVEIGCWLARGLVYERLE